MIRLWHCYFISISKFQPFSCQMSTLTSSLRQRDFKCHLDAKQFLLDLLTIWFVNSRNVVGNGQESSFLFQNDGKVSGLTWFWLGSGCTCKVLRRPNKNITILKRNMATLQCRKCKEAEETAGPVLFDNLATRSLEMGEERVGRRTLHEWFQGSLKAWGFTVCEDF